MPNNKIQQRAINGDMAEIQNREEHMTGFAALYNQDYKYTVRDNRGREITIIERIVPGAFTQDLIDNSDVRATQNHNPDRVLARSKYGYGTMTLSIDEKGLKFDFVPNKNYSDLIESVQRGDVDQCSYKYMPGEETMSAIDENTVLREIRSFEELLDIAIVTYPAYTQTSVSVEQRTMEKILSVLPETEDEKIKEVAALETAERERVIQMM